MADGVPISSLGRAADGLPSELLIWLSPAFPSGAFAFSHGLERLAEAGVVTVRGELESWLCDLARHGSLRNDLILVAAAWRAAVDGDVERLDTVAELAAALSSSAERRLETLTQGRAFSEAILAAWPEPLIARLWARDPAAIAYPVALGAAAGGRRLTLAATLDGYAIAFVTNLVSAAIRLSIIGQFDGQRVLAALLGELRLAAVGAAAATLDDIGGAMILTDIASIEHETQHTRLFRS